MIEKILKKNPGKKKKRKGIPRTVQQTLPYLEAYANGVIQSDKGVFTKTWQFGDISFRTKSEEEQEYIYGKYMKFLNTFNPGEDVYITMVNTPDNMKQTEEMYPLRGDGMDEYRKELSTMLLEKRHTAGTVRQGKYLTVSIEADSVDKAMDRLGEISDEMEQAFQRFTKQPLKALELGERLEVMHSILNGGEPNYWFEHDIKGNTRVDFERMAKLGLGTKDIIAPEAMKFNGNNIQLGESRYGQAVYLDNLANWLNTNFFMEMSSQPFEGVTTLHIQVLVQEEAIKLIHNQSVNISGEIMEKQKKSMQEGYGEGYISAELANAQEQVEELQDDLLNRDQKLFFMSMTMVHFAEDMEKLKSQWGILRSTASKYACSVKVLMMQQERGLASNLALGIDRTYTKRLLTTESLGIFLPFDEITHADAGGFYYGSNTVNKSLIIYNRLKGQNYNGLILGSSGSGKSFSAKREMTNVILNTDHDIYIIDPDSEYTPLAEAFNGSVIKITPGNGVHINPFDLDIDTSHDTGYNPLAMKADFIAGMLETMLGPGASLTPIQKSIVGRCIQQIYRPYIEHLQELPPDSTGRKRTIDRQYCPTMQNLFDALLSHPSHEAQQLALIMETYTTGMFDTFAHRTNVDLENRLMVYDIKDVGSNMMELALKVCMNDAWMKMVENRRKNKWTWLYIDEFHLLLSNDSTSEFLKTVWKRARKWQGVPTGITQNVEDLLASSEARAIINNSSFVYMMNQSAMDRNMLGELLHLTETDLEAITNAEPGSGLIHTGKYTIPFTDRFPENTKLFRVMTTAPDL